MDYILTVWDRSLRVLQQIERRTPPRIPRRSITTLVDALPAPAPYLPFVPSRSALNSPCFAGPPIASSSKVTLADPIWSTPGPFPRYPISAALQFATDDDLAAALVLTREESSWTTSIDPGLAFLAVRERPTYSIFLQSVGDVLERIYGRLKRSGTHELLVTDLLLKQSDPRVLRTVLELDTAAVPSDRLRSSLVASLYAHIARHLESRAISPLSRAANLRIASLLVSLNQPRYLQTVFNDLYRVADDDEQSIWPLFQIIAYTLRTDVGTATSMFMALVQDDREIIPRQFLGKTSPTHPAWREIMALGAMTRCTLRWAKVDEALDLTDRLLAYMLEYGSTSSGMDAVLEAARVATSVGTAPLIEWVQTTFKRMASNQNIPPIHSVAVDDALEARPDPEWYQSLSLDTYEPPSPRVLVSLVSDRNCTADVLRRISHDLARLDPATTRPIANTMLNSLAKHNMLDQIRSLTAEYRPVLSGEVTLHVVQAAMRADDRSLARDFLHDYERQAEWGAGGLKLEERLLLAEGFVIAKNERRALAHLEMLKQSEEDPERVKAAVVHAIRRLGRASRLAKLARPLFKLKARDI